jgi:hypothetical protein
LIGMRELSRRSSEDKGLAFVRSRSGEEIAPSDSIKTSKDAGTNQNEPDTEALHYSRSQR